MRTQAALLAMVLGMACPAGAEVPMNPSVIDAKLTIATDRYDHGVLGDAIEWGGMEMTYDLCSVCSEPFEPGTGRKRIEVTLPASRVFEDVEARVADLDGDGANEVLVVETDLKRGASLAVYDAGGKVTATPFIGATHRWLAPAGIGDLDGDGLPEIAYVDRPHLARELVILTYRNRKLTEIARVKGVTNHRIGESAISGGYRFCGERGEIVVASGDWSQVIAVGLSGKMPTTRNLGALKNPASLKHALACKT